MKDEILKKLSVLTIVFVPLTSIFSAYIFPKFIMSFAFTLLGIVYLYYPIRFEVLKVRRSNVVLVILMLAEIYVQLMNNQALKNGDYQYTLYYLTFVVGFIVCCKTKEWINFILKFAQIISMVYVLGTIFFYYNANQYISFVTWKYPEKMVSLLVNYEKGYMSGLFDNYSACGIWMALSIAFSFSALMKEQIGWRKIYYWLSTFLSGAALLLTAKRGVTIYTACALILVVFFCNANHPISRWFKIVGAIVLTLGVIQIAAEYIPELNNVFLRFDEYLGGGDNAVEGRIAMRQTAMALFREHPFVGIGWRGFLYSGLYSDGDVHNTFAQLLCETGVLGFTVYVSFVLIAVIKTIKLLVLVQKSDGRNKDKTYHLAYSLFIQIVFFMYFVSGNPLYDLSLLCPYFIGIWILGYYNDGGDNQRIYEF